MRTHLLPMVRPRTNQKITNDFDDDNVMMTMIPTHEEFGRDGGGGGDGGSSSDDEQGTRLMPLGTQAAHQKLFQQCDTAATVAAAVVVGR